MLGRPFNRNAGTNGIVGGGIPYCRSGAAFGAKYRNNGRIVVFFSEMERVTKERFMKR